MGGLLLGPQALYRIIRRCLYCHKAQQDHDAGRHTGGKPDNIDRRIQLVPGQVAPGDDEIGLKHIAARKMPMLQYAYYQSLENFSAVKLFGYVHGASGYVEMQYIFVLCE